MPGPGEELITDPADRNTPQENGWTLSYPRFVVSPGFTHTFSLSGMGPGGGPEDISFRMTITDGAYSYDSPDWVIPNDGQYYGCSLEALLPYSWDPTTTTIFITIIIPPVVPPFTFRAASLTYSPWAPNQYLPIVGIG